MTLLPFGSPPGIKGDTGATGPNSISTSTDTNITGVIKGTGTKIAQASDGTDYLSPTTGVKTNTGTAAQYVTAKYTDTVTTGAVTANWNNGNVHYIVLDAGANTITLSNPISGGRYMLILKNTASTVTFSPVPKWANGNAPVLSATGQVDIITLVWDGTDYFGSYSLNYTP